MAMGRNLVHWPPSSPVHPHHKDRTMPVSREQLERDREAASGTAAPDPVEQDSERLEQAEEGIAEEEARERQK
jgi:hypothetical protein